MAGNQRPRKAAGRSNAPLLTAAGRAQRGCLANFAPRL